MSKNLLVFVGEEKAPFPVEFSGCDYQGLVEVIREELQDETDCFSRDQEIARLEIFRPKFCTDQDDGFVRLTTKKVGTIKDKDRLKVVLKVSLQHCKRARLYRSAMLKQSPV